MSIEDDLRAEGEPEKEFVPGIAGRLPSKRVAAGALIRDRQGRVLLVEPVYKPFLDIPGGVVEEDESPLAACRRELGEELGITVQIGRLLVVDWVPAQGVWGDGLLFVFDGGVVGTGQVEAIRLPPDELKSFVFLSVEDAVSRLRASMGRRIASAYGALGEGGQVYAEFGRRSVPR